MEQQRKVIKTIIVFLLIAIAMGATISSYMEKPLSNFIPHIIGTIFLLIEFMRIQRAADLNLSINAICIFMYCCCLLFCIQNNGLAPGAIIAFYLPACIATSLQSIQRGALWLALIILTHIFLAILPHTPFDFPSPSSAVLEKGIRYSIPVFSGILVLFFFYLASINQTLIKKLEGLNYELENRNEHKKQFLARMSHEVRTPLNGIYGISQLLKISEEEEKEDYLDTLDFSVQNLLHIVNEILDYSKIEKGMIQLEKRAFNLKQLLNQIVNLYTPRCQESGLSLIGDISMDIPEEVYSDSFRLSQILSNLINNAIKFTRKGKITVTATLGEKKGTLIFKVKDTGIGIPQDKLHTIFEEYSQVDSSISRSYGGTGLGLNITKDLVELLGGEINVESTPEKGTQFTLWIPLETVPPTSEKEKFSETLSAQAGSQRPILIVEDNFVNQKIVRKFLLKSGYSNIHIVENGLLALNEVQDKKYDLILMDVNMPEMNGIQATQEIRKLEVEQPVIVALTANALEEEKENCLEAGMNDYLSKPIKINELKNILQKYLKKKGLEFQSH